MKTFKEFKDFLAEQSDLPDLPVVTHKSPYEGADIGEQTTSFLSSPGTAQKFAKHIISKGGKARIGRSGQTHFVYHNIVLSKEQFRKETSNK